MKKEQFVNIITFILVGLLIVALWPIIKWLALLMIVLLLAGIAYTLISAKRIKKEIEKDPNAYYSSNNHSNENVIDVEYKEKEVQEEKV